MEPTRICLLRQLTSLKQSHPVSPRFFLKSYSTQNSSSPSTTTGQASSNHDGKIQDVNQTLAIDNINENGNKNSERRSRIEGLIQRMKMDAQKTIVHRQQLARDRVRLSQLGSVQTTLKSAQPSFFRNNSPSDSQVTLAALITATAHLGHNKSLTCPTNYPLIYGTRSDISIIDLRKTLTYLRRASNVVRETVQNDGMVLFAHGVDGTEKAIKLASERLEKNGYWLGLRPKNRNSVWVRGTLTNAPEVLKGPRQVAKQLRLASESPEDGQQYPSRRQQSDNLESTKFLPSLIIVFNPKASKVLLREAALRQIPTIGVIDTDVDPRIVTYPIPANDDSVRSIELIAGILSRAGQEGLRRRTQKLSLILGGSEIEKSNLNLPI